MTRNLNERKMMKETDKGTIYKFKKFHFERVA